MGLVKLGPEVKKFSVLDQWEVRDTGPHSVRSC